MAGDGAWVGIAATILVVVAAAVLGATAYSTMSGFKPALERAPEVSLGAMRTTCGVDLAVLDASGTMAWNDLSVRYAGTGPYRIVVRATVADDETWNGSALAQRTPVVRGDIIAVETPSERGAVEVVRVRDALVVASVPLEDVLTQPPERACENPPPSQAATGVFDPGFAYEDADHDFRYTPDVDVAIADDQIRRGVYASSGGNGLVLPPSVGAIVVDGPISLRSSGAGSTTIAVELRSDADLRLDGGVDVRLLDASLRSASGAVEVSGGRAVLADDVIVLAEERVSFTAPSMLQLNRSAISSGGPVDVRVTAAGPLFAEAAVVTARESISLGGVGSATRGAIFAERAHLTSLDGSVELIATGPEAHVRLTDSALVAARSILVESAMSGRITVEGATFDDLDDIARLGPAGVAVVGAPHEGKALAVGQARGQAFPSR